MAIAADLLRAADFILKRGAPCQELGGDFYDRLDTNKTKARLVRRHKNLGDGVEPTPVA